ncbi:syntaxin-5-like protein [Perkinsela sp. CCAP 1560/4]|nr:syntaxin-5-like protein [Perkinsela sp. CCAP 1560/4]|eukprot:KNH09340.1 syntaxin-5-like protein [Perkinsela sp. CCAP 1560/4]
MKNRRMGANQGIYDRTTDFQKLVRNERKRGSANGQSYLEEVSLTIPGDERPTQLPQASTNIQSAADQLAYSIEYSFKMLEKLESTRHCQRSSERASGSPFSDDLVSEMTVRVDSHRAAFATLATRIDTRGFVPTLQISQHYAAVKVALRSRILEVSRNFKRVLTRQLAAASWDSAISANDVSNVGQEKEFITKDAEHQLCIYSNPIDTASEALRKRQIQKIEGAVSELSEMMQEVAHLVVEQESLVRQIDMNVDHSLNEINMGNFSLTSFAEKFRSRGRLIIRVLAVVLCIILLAFGVGVV